MNNFINSLTCFSVIYRVNKKVLFWLVFVCVCLIGGSSKKYAAAGSRRLPEVSYHSRPVPRVWLTMDEAVAHAGELYIPVYTRFLDSWKNSDANCSFSTKILLKGSKYFSMGYFEKSLWDEICVSMDCSFDLEAVRDLITNFVGRFYDRGAMSIRKSHWICYDIEENDAVRRAIALLEEIKS